MNSMNPLLQIIVALVWALAGILLLVFIWDWLITFADLILDDFYLGMYWVGVAMMIFLCILLPPISLILDAYKNEDEVVSDE